eukprot:15482622-Alexandrium_andersonii.AAC.1
MPNPMAATNMSPGAAECRTPAPQTPTCGMDHMGHRRPLITYLWRTTWNSLNPALRADILTATDHDLYMKRDRPQQ